MDHPPYSPDLAPTDFWLLPKFKIALKEKRFSDVEDIKSETKKRETILLGILKNCFEQWPKR
jgi:hypothetical protein